MLKHREKLHHEEGIEKITEELTKKYGEVYRTIISEEAKTHVKDDMGYIPKKTDYETPHFWPKWQAKNEIQCAWL